MHAPRLAALLVLLAALPLAAAEPADTARGDRMLDAYFDSQVRQIANACLADVKSTEDWEKKRPEYRRQFFDMMGLWPLPPRTDLKPTVTGTLDGGAFTVEKLHFQSSPGLYVTGNLYVPKDLKAPAPAVLYVCGHGSTILDGVSYGNKVNYQHHPAWFAENGYVCLIVDTLQLGEVQGLHHGTHRFGMWWWQTLGYTPAGIECWNAMRALDYLETRKEVDAKRLGVTGRSGGGATSWWVAAADDRVKCIIPVAGIADLHAHVVEGVSPRLKKGVITGHCDCMYTVNTYRWDYAQVAALCAPRPLMLGNSDADDIFPVPGYRRLADKVKKVYDLYGAGDKFVLLETAGPHKDTPELRAGAFRWMNRWLKNDAGEVSEKERVPFKPEQLQVVKKAPADAVNAIVHETFLRPARPELPQSAEVTREWWKGQREKWTQALRERVFRGWPQNPPDLNVRPAGDVSHDGLRLRAFDFLSEEAVELRVWLLTSEKVKKPGLVVLSSVDEAGWQEWQASLGPEFRDVLGVSEAPKLDAARFEQHRKALEFHRWSFAVVAPRGVGPTRWSELDEQKRPAGHQIRRRFALLGQTLDGQRAWDVRRALAALRDVKDLKEADRCLQGKGDMAGIVLYAGLFEPAVKQFDLWQLPPSHAQGPTFLNVRRVLDAPQAVALAFPREVRLHLKDEAALKDWDWPVRLQKALGAEYLKAKADAE